MLRHMRLVVAVLALVVAAAASVTASATTTRTARVPTSIEVNGTPLAIAYGYGSVWIGAHDVTALYRLNPATGHVREIDDSTNACGPLGVAFGRIWVGHCDTGDTDGVIDARTNRLVGRVKGLGFGFGFGTAWVDEQKDNPSIVDRIAPKTLRVLDRIQGGIGIAASADGFMWMGGGGTLSQIDPRSNRVLGTFRYGGGGYAWGLNVAGKIWIEDVGDNVVYVFDPHSKTSRKLSVRLAFSADFGDPYMVLAGGRVWMLTSNEGLSVKGLVAVDPTSGKVVRRVTVPDGLGPYFAVVNGAVWAAQPDEDRVVRIPLS